MKALSILLVMISGTLLASEVDQFTHRYFALKDSTDAINLFLNQQIKKGVVLANGYEGCNETLLNASLRKYLKKGQGGVLSRRISGSNKIDKKAVSLNESIYRDLSALDSLSLGLLARLSEKPMGVIVQVGRHQIGVDKIEHFLGSGFYYYHTHYNLNHSLSTSLAMGDLLERAHLGAMTTGVYSYADLVANFNGMRFWNHILNKSDDALGAEHNLGPYIGCRNGKWRQLRDVKIENYVDSGWDEAFNCSKFRSDEITRKVVSSIEHLQKMDQRNYHCPIETTVFGDLSSKYGEFYPLMFNPEGHETLEVSFW